MDESLPELPRGVKTLYRPRGEALEYAPLAVMGLYRGCPHACRYCYCPQVLHMPRDEFNVGGEPRPRILQRLERDAAKCETAGIREQVFLCFTTDVYHTKDTSTTREAIRTLQAQGLGVCALTKGGTRALRDADLFRPDRDAFACTLTSLDASFSMKWEPGAALPEDRIAALRAFHEAGIFTWVSLEPVLDVDASAEIVAATCRYVDHYKAGRANYLPQTKTTDWRAYTERMVKVFARVGAAHYFKADLQPYLPTGYANPLRVAQHHAPREVPEVRRG